MKIIHLFGNFLYVHLRLNPCYCVDSSCPKARVIFSERISISITINLTQRTLINPPKTNDEKKKTPRKTIEASISSSESVGRGLAKSRYKFARFRLSAYPFSRSRLLFGAAPRRETRREANKNARAVFSFPHSAKTTLKSLFRRARIPTYNSRRKEGIYIPCQIEGTDLGFCCVRFALCQHYRELRSVAQSASFRFDALDFRKRIFLIPIAIIPN